MSGTTSFLKASLPQFLPAVDVPWPVSSVPEAWKEAAVGTAALALRAKEETLVNDLFEGRVLSANLDLKLGSTRLFQTSESGLAVSSTSAGRRLGLVESSCAPRSPPLMSSAVSSPDGGLGENRLRCFAGCGLAARESLADDASASWLGLVAMFV